MEENYGTSLTNVVARLVYYSMCIGSPSNDKELNKSIYNLDKLISTQYLFKEIFEKFNLGFTFSDNTLIIDVNHEDSYRIELTPTKINLLKEWFGAVRYE